MNGRVRFVATCAQCQIKQEFTAYGDRADWVGRHRLRTGHSVNMYIEGGS